MIDFDWNALKANIFLIDACRITFSRFAYDTFGLCVLLAYCYYLGSYGLLRWFHKDMFVTIILYVSIFVDICLSAIKSRLKITHFMINNIIKFHLTIQFCLEATFLFILVWVPPVIYEKSPM
jgi:hypothetical protein